MVLRRETLRMAHPLCIVCRDRRDHALAMSSFCFRGKAGTISRHARKDQDRQPMPHSNLAGDANGLLASTTNMTSWSRSVVPALNTSIGMSAPCPFMDLPASA